MRSFSCWRATRVRARPLSPPLDAPALQTLGAHSCLSLLWGQSRDLPRRPPRPRSAAPQLQCPGVCGWGCALSAAPAAAAALPAAASLGSAVGMLSRGLEPSVLAASLLTT